MKGAICALFDCKKERKVKRMAQAGISTVGIKFGYALETVAGTMPSAFTMLDRINTIAGIDLSTEQIDASALED